MLPFTESPIPIIDPRRCNGCGLCVHACPNKVLGLYESKAIVSHPLACDYAGACEAVCPLHAITRPFEIVILEGNKRSKSDKSR